MISEKKWTDRLFDLFTYVLLIFLALMCIAPFLHILAVSLSATAPSMGGFVKFWPIGFNLENYRKILGAPAFQSSFLISLERTLLGTSINMLVLILAAYPLSKTSQEFKGRNVFMWVFLFAMLFNGGLIPTFLVVRGLGLMDTIWALVLPGALQIFSLFLMMNFFRDVPKELEEAAVIDGANHWQILYNVYLPISLPALATLTLFAAVGHWNAWFDGAIYMTRAENYPLQTFLRTVVVQLDLSRLMVDPNALAQLSNRSLKAAQIFVTIFPILLVYPFLQRYFITGIKLGAIKG
uniref:Carbohydrate ABC transporter permease n=1 Tax=Anaerolinea thermolimosa TaxID=229919 RepID=A0A7C4PM08_9CHLR